MGVTINGVEFAVTESELRRLADSNLPCATVARDLLDEYRNDSNSQSSVSV
jgi:hypothetical protein